MTHDINLPTKPGKVSKPEHKQEKSQVAFSLNKNARLSLRENTFQKGNNQFEPPSRESPDPYGEREKSEVRVTDIKIGTITSTFEKNVIQNGPDSEQISETESRKDKLSEQLRRVSFANRDPERPRIRHQEIIQSIMKTVKRFPVPIQRSFFYMLQSYFQNIGILNERIVSNPLKEIAATLDQKNSLSDRSEKRSARSATNSVARQPRNLLGQIERVKLTQGGTRPPQLANDYQKPFVEISNIVENHGDAFRQNHYFPFENRMPMNRETKNGFLKPVSKVRRRPNEFSLNVRKVEECFVSHKIKVQHSNKNSMIELNMSSKVRRNEGSPNFESAVVKGAPNKDAHFTDVFKEPNSVFDPDLKKIHHLIFFGTKTPALYSVIGENSYQRDKSLGIIKMGEAQSLKQSEPPNLADSQSKLAEKISSLGNYLLSEESAVEFDNDKAIRDKIKRVVSRLNSKFSENHASCGVDCPHIKVFIQYLDRYISKLKKRGVISLPVIKLDKPEIPRLQGFLGHIANSKLNSANS